ncbi:hypothetical protein BP6252_01990 [Coleophoma cylindrospora]|uniref:Uncharacterized protein n=1 Tax=Coleophoma cylindrospora TaxID=1849047 RepID=A0A3D8SDJ4_9HELO|nr:hypothetical protein BP6252_01990 [Coleophoma cylindrospora]
MFTDLTIPSSYQPQSSLRVVIMLTVYQPAKSASKEASEDEVEEVILPAKRPYLTKVNGRLVMARQKHDRSASAMNLLGEAFGLSTTRVIRRRPSSPEIEKTVPVYNTLPNPQRHYYPTNYASPDAIQAVSSPVLLYPGNMIQVVAIAPPQLLPSLPRRMSLQTINSQAASEPCRVIGEDLAQLHLLDAHYRAYVAQNKDKIPAENAAEKQTSCTTAVTDQQASSKTTITITKHVCAGCGRLRSRKYHHNNPIQSGEEAKQTFCRKCQKDPSSTSSDDNDKVEKKRKNKQKRKKGKKGKVPLASVSIVTREILNLAQDSESPSSEAVEIAADASNKPALGVEKELHRTLKIKEIKRRPSAEYIVVEEYESDDQPQENGGSATRRYLEESDISGRMQTSYAVGRNKSTSHKSYQTSITARESIPPPAADNFSPSDSSHLPKHQGQRYRLSPRSKDYNKGRVGGYDDHFPRPISHSVIHARRRGSQEYYEPFDHEDPQVQKDSHPRETRHYLEDQSKRYTPSSTRHYYDPNTFVEHQPFIEDQRRSQDYPEGRYSPDFAESSFPQWYANEVETRRVHPQSRQQRGRPTYQESSREHFETSHHPSHKGRQDQETFKEQFPAQSSFTRRRRERQSSDSPVLVARPWEKSLEIRPEDGDEVVVVTERFTYLPKNSSVSKNSRTYAYVDRKHHNSYLRTGQFEPPVDASKYYEDWFADESDKRVRHRERLARKATYGATTDRWGAENPQRAEETAYQSLPRAPSPPSPTHRFGSSNKIPNTPPYPRSSDSDLEMEVEVERLDDPHVRLVMPGNKTSSFEKVPSPLFDNPSPERIQRRRGRKARDSKELAKVRARSVSNHKPPYVGEATDGGAEIASIFPHHQSTGSQSTDALGDENKSEGNRRVRFISPESSVTISEDSSEVVRNLEPAVRGDEDSAVTEEYELPRKLKKNPAKVEVSGWNDHSPTEHGDW